MSEPRVFCALRSATLALGVAGCAPSALAIVHPVPALTPKSEETRVADFERIEAAALDLLSAADPRLAVRTHLVASDAVLSRIGAEGVLSEDVTAQIRGRSLDLFAFRGRAKALDEALKSVVAFDEALPDVGPRGGRIARPTLERELLVRLIQEERERVRDEERFGRTSGDLIRGILSTWTPPAAPQDWPDRDAWISRHLFEIRDAFAEKPAEGPSDLDEALYPLERLLEPLVFPRGAAAIASIRIAIDQDARPAELLAPAARIARIAKEHLGVNVDVATLPPSFARIESKLRSEAGPAIADVDGGAESVLVRARALLFREGSCPAAERSRVSALDPPPERAAICGALASLADDPQAAVIAFHDDVLIALAAVSTSPPPRTLLLSAPRDDRVDAFEREARERPGIAIGVALAAELLFSANDSTSRLAAWLSLGDMPLDIAERELKAARDSR